MLSVSDEGVCTEMVLNFHQVLTFFFKVGQLTLSSIKQKISFASSILMSAAAVG